MGRVETNSNPDATHEPLGRRALPLLLAGEKKQERPIWGLPCTAFMDK
jgi:hypothetical protein